MRKGKELSIGEVLALKDGTKVWVEYDQYKWIFETCVDGIETKRKDVLCNEKGEKLGIKSALKFNTKYYEYEEEIVLKRKVGDQVRVKDNLIQGYVEGTDQGNFISEKMISFGGKIAKITKLLTDEYDYELDIDEERFLWSECMVEDVKVQEYQTWEVIKALVENPKLKFGVIDEYNSSKIPNCIALLNENGDITWDNSTRTIYLSEAHIHYKWVLMEETNKLVTFLEAVNAYEDGKEIYSVRDKINVITYNKEFATIGMTDENDNAVATDEILNAEWYIK